MGTIFLISSFFLHIILANISVPFEHNSKLLSLREDFLHFHKFNQLKNNR